VVGVRDDALQPHPPRCVSVWEKAA